MTAAPPTRSEPSPGGWRSPGFILRTPLLPCEVLDGVSIDLKASGISGRGDGSDLEAALDSDRALVRDRLRALFDDPALREAIYLAAPEALRALGPTPAEARRRRRADRTLWSYIARMTTRATPFGLMAGWSVGGFGQRTHLQLPPRARYERTTRVDLAWLDALERGVDAGWDERTVLRASPSHYLLRGRVHYIRARPGQVGRMVAVSASEPVRAVLVAARDGATADQLRTELRRTGLGPKRAQALLETLFERELLIPEGRLLATGGDPGAEVSAALRQRPGGAPLADRLDAAQDGLRALDREPLGAEPARYERILAPLRDEASPDPPTVQVDLRKPAPELRLGPRALAVLVRAAELLARLEPDQWDPLMRFRATFAERYERREVRLVEALDPEAGIGLPLPDPVQTWSPREAHLLCRLQELLPGEELRLSATDLDALEQPGRRELPDAFSLHVTLAAVAEADVDAGRFRVIVNSAAGPSGARLLGRLAASDPDVLRLIAEHLRHEESLDPDALYVELATLSAAYSPMYLHRPVLREHELEYGGSSGLPAERRLAIGELLLSLDVDDQFVLRSQRDGRRVVIRLSSAFNYWLPVPPVVRFLGLMQAQGRTRPLGFSWGALDSATWLPRVRCGQVVLARARWRLLDGSSLLAGAAERHAALSAWRQRLGVPRRVRLAEGEDMPLTLDLENVICQELLASRVRAGQPVILQEDYPDTHSQCVRGPEGRYVHELVVPLARSRPALPPTAVRADGRVGMIPTHERTFAPGSSWLTAKLYASPDTFDGLLREVVAPLREDVLASGAATIVHFLRYADPHEHLRVRFHGEPARLCDTVLPALLEASGSALEDGTMWRVQLDTYRRELERYGGSAGTRLTERLWHADSEAVLVGLTGVRRAERRWLLATVGVDRLLADAGLDPAARLALLRRLRDSVADRLGLTVSPKALFADRARETRSEVELALAAAGGAEAAPVALEALAQRSVHTKPIYARLRELEQQGELTRAFAQVVGSHLHLHANRALPRADGVQELRLYDALERHYAGAIARQTSAPA